VVPPLGVMLGIKKCVACGQFFSLEAFRVDRSSKRGLQSWCIRCKANWERGVDGSWLRWQAWLEKHEPMSLGEPSGWTEHMYKKRWQECDGKCEWCGAGLGEWQTGGHHQDRIDNDTPHIPSNCRMLCWPCNRRKSNRSPHVALREANFYVAEWGRGRVPWQTIEPWARRAVLPNVEQYKVDVQMNLPIRNQ
jgi:hypothetical protein